MCIRDSDRLGHRVRRSAACGRTRGSSRQPSLDDRVISRAVVLAGLAVGIIVHEVTWPGVLVVAIIDRIGDTFFSPASVAALPRIVDDTQFEGAAAMTEARLYGAQLAGPSLGGILYGLARSVPYFGDAASYGVSVLLSLIHI